MVKKTQKKRGAKPWDWKADLDKIESLAALGSSQEQVAHNIGISPATYYAYKAKQVEILEAYKKGKDKGIVKVTNALFKKATGGDNIAAIFYLKNRDPENWKDKHHNEHSGEIDNSLTITYVTAKVDK